MSAPSNPTARRFRDALEQNGRARCLSVRLMSDPVIAYIAAAAGFEAIYVDLEHAVIPLDRAAAICLAAQSKGMLAAVRVGEKFTEFGPLLDAGVDAFILTGVQDPAAVAPRLAALRFPPHGSRSINWSTPATDYRRPDDAAVHLASRPFVAVMIETAEAVEAARDIAALDGVDMLFIGCSDLALSMGLGSDVSAPAITQACIEGATAAWSEEKHFGLGGASTSGTLASRILAMGPTMLTGGSEQGLLVQSLNRQAQALANI